MAVRSRSLVIVYSHVVENRPLHIDLRVAHTHTQHRAPSVVVAPLCRSHVFTSPVLHTITEFWTTRPASRGRFSTQSGRRTAMVEIEPRIRPIRPLSRAVQADRGAHPSENLSVAHHTNIWMQRQGVVEELLHRGPALFV